MKILFGVQGTGNGHLSRARAMALAFEKTTIEVDYLFSGRAADRFFAMDCFGNFRVRRGLTFVNIDGRVDYLKTVTGNDYRRFLRDVFALDLSSYDLVISDFEPISAWAGRLRGKTVISMGHQPAFDFSVPVARRDLRTTLVMKLFAPGSVRVGMHWASFGAPILPPLIDLQRDSGHPPERIDGDKVLVYLPFESLSAVCAMLTEIKGYEFYIYSPDAVFAEHGHLHLRPTSLDGFRRDLEQCTAVIGNAGFELASECLAAGKRLLVKPQGQQMEQASNALALTELGYAESLERLTVDGIRRWLQSPGEAPCIDFPDVAAALAAWLERGDFTPGSLGRMSHDLWKQVRIRRGGPLMPALCRPSPARSGKGALRAV